MIRETVASRVEIHSESPAYRSGWEDGRFGSPGTFVANASLSIWTEYLTGSPTTRVTATAGESGRC